MHYLLSPVKCVASEAREGEMTQVSSVVISWRYISIVVALLLVAAFGQGKHKAPIPNNARSDGLTEREWTEDVLLDDGSNIVVVRTALFRETSSLGGGAYNAVEKDASLSFTGELAQLPAWHAPLIAMLL